MKKVVYSVSRFNKSGNNKLTGIGFITEKDLMNELEKQLADIEDKIELEKYNEQKILTKEKVMAYLTNAILKKPKTLIHTLIQKIIVYEDKVEIFYNYTDETNPGDDSPRDLSYYSGSDSSVILEIVGIEPMTS